MKKLFGLLVIGSVSAFVACTSDSESNPYNVGSNNTDPTGCAIGTVAALDANGNVVCMPLSSSSAVFVNPVPVYSSSVPFINPVPVSSSTNIIQPIGVSSSSFVVNPVTPTYSSSSAIAPVTPKSSSSRRVVTPVVEEEDDGIFTLGLWDGADGKNQVPTGNKDGGYWYSYTDDGNNGSSTLEWDTDAAVGSTYSDDDLSPVIKACGGLCGKFDLIAGANEDCAPYVAVAFNYAKTDKMPGDASSSKGMCITYKSTMPIEVDMGLGSKDATYGYNIPAYILPRSTTASTVDIMWTEFEQQWEGEKAITGKAAAAMLVAIKFQIKGTEIGTDEGTGTFLISKVGGYGECN